MANIGLNASVIGAQKAFGDNWLSSANGWVVVHSSHDAGAKLLVVRLCAKCAESAIKGGRPIIVPTYKFLASLGLNNVCVSFRDDTERLVVVIDGRRLWPPELYPLQFKYHYGLQYRLSRCNISPASYPR